MQDKDLDHPFNIASLINKLRAKNITSDEEQQLQEWIAKSDENKMLFEALTNDEVIAEELEKIAHYEVMERTSRLMKELDIIEAKPRVFTLSTWTRRIAASLLFLLACTLVYFTFFNKKKEQEIVQASSQQERFRNDVLPGSNSAQLILADGRIVNLDSLTNGTLATQDGARITRLANGEIVYDASISTGEVKLNTINNPAGSKVISLVLADGSRIWLNAASSLTYPTAFTGNERKVSITGEAYFEIAPNKSMPFYVTKGATAVQVLGTHFNVNTFEDEATLDITLLEGSVQVNHNTSQLLLKPGQQAQVDKSGIITLSTEVDIEKVMAWKNGKFYFDGADIKTIMKQVARWYNAEVIYQSEPDYSFVADIPRDVPVSDLLKLLEATGLVHFKIEGNKITVMK